MQRIAPLVLVSTFVLCAPLTARADAPTFEPPVVLSNTPNTDVGSSDFAPVAATNGSGTWVVAWKSSDTLHGTIDSDYDILFMRSTDGGLTFSDPAPLNTTAYDDTWLFYQLVIGQHDTKPALAANGNRFIAVWERDIPSQFVGVPVPSIALARSDDGGVTWTPPAMLYDRSYAPSIATDGSGTWVLVWHYRPLNSPNTDGDIFYTRSTDDGLSWSPPATLNTNAAIDVDTDRNAEVVWSNGVWGVGWWAGLDSPTYARVFVARSLDGQTWTAPLNLHPASPTTEDREIDLAGGEGGGWVATWESGDASVNGTRILTARSADGGLTWSAPTILNTDHATDGRDEFQPQIAAQGADTFAVVWKRSEVAHADVLVAMSTDAGATWSAPTPLNPVAAADGEPNDLDIDPSITADAGRFFAVWVSSDRQLASNTKTNDLDVVMSLAGEPCGNGMFDAGEICDDGDRGALDCCGRTCGHDPAGAVCAADADPCSLERCDGAGTCGHEAAPVDTPCAPDADICSYDRCDGNFVCEHLSAPRPVCPGSARVGGSALKISGADPVKRKLTWSLKHGPDQPFARFVNGATHALCMYDASGLIARMDAPVDTSCQGQSCWRSAGSGIKYSDKDGTPTGATSSQLKRAKSGVTSLKLVGKGPNLATPSLPITLPIQVQLVSDEMNTCFGATYSGAGLKSNAGNGFKATSD